LYTWGEKKKGMTQGGEKSKNPIKGGTAKEQGRGGVSQKNPETPRKKSRGKKGKNAEPKEGMG